MGKHDGIMLEGHPVVSHEEWVAARGALLAKEKELTHLREELSRQRRALPWERVTKRYLFDAPRGAQKSLEDLFADKSQLVVYHFMFSPEWEAGCKHCSFWADNFSGIQPHLGARDVAFAAISRAPIEKIEAFKTRMQWTFPWVSSGRTDFNYDYQASFTPEARARGPVVYNYAEVKGEWADREGISVFYKDGNGALFHTYSTYARGIDPVNAAYQFLDLVPKGRDEGRLQFTQEWVRHHDAYD
jgi:predicted dithiol-disulfide oxidoreductase (DUF899 family)